jgi:hypothetical protein
MPPSGSESFANTLINKLPSQLGRIATSGAHKGALAAGYTVRLLVSNAFLPQLSVMIQVIRHLVGELTDGIVKSVVGPVGLEKLPPQVDTH